MGASIALALCDGSRKAIMYGTGSSSPTRPPQLPPATGHVPSACPKRIALGRLRRYGANDCLHQDKSIPLSALQHRAVSHGSMCASRATAIDPNFVARFPAHDGPVSARSCLCPTYREAASVGSFAVTRCDQPRWPMMHLCDIRSTPTSGAS